MTLFNGARHHPVQEALELLRKADANSLFRAAKEFLSKEEARAELLTVADAVQTIVLSPGEVDAE